MPNNMIRPWEDVENYFANLEVSLLDTSQHAEGARNYGTGSGSDRPDCSAALLSVKGAGPVPLPVLFINKVKRRISKQMQDDRALSLS